MKRLTIIFLFTLSTVFALPAWAQPTQTVSETITITGQTQEGQLISFTNNQFAPSQVEYDEDLFGVIVAQSPINLKDTNQPNGQKVVTNGIAPALVSTANGPITKGDYLTSSTKPGVAMKATKPGKVIGQAMQEYIETDKNKTTLITATINPEYWFGQKATTSTNLISLLKSAVQAPNIAPLTSLRYLFAVIIGGAAFLFGLLYLGAMIIRAIEAIGRNPSASRTIQLSLLVSAVVTIVIALIGLFLAYLILIF